MFIDAKEVLKMIKPGDRVLDVGGAAEVFPRANAVIDILPYKSRKPGQLKDIPEQFGAEDWYVGDICAPQVWSNFKDKDFDFVICSHVLEDIRDPVFVCGEMIRIAKAGYIESPSRFRECAKWNPDQPVSGWEHHRWIVDVENDTLVFTPKLHWANQFDYLGNRRRQYLADHSFQFVALQWEGSFNYQERCSKGSALEAENQFYFYDTFPYKDPRPFHVIRNAPHAGKTFLWFDEFKLPIERLLTPEEIEKRHQQRITNRWKRAFKGIRRGFRKIKGEMG